MDCGEKERMVSQFVLEELASGDFPAGTFLATETELAERFGLSRYRVHKALHEFFQRNIVVCRRRGGLSVGPGIAGLRKRNLPERRSRKVLVINHCPARYGWSGVHVNEIFFSALTQGLSTADLELVCEDVPIGSAWSEIMNVTRRHVENHSPRAVIVINGGNFSKQFQEFYYLLHDKVFIYTRTGFLEGYPLLSTVGIANCLDGVAAAEIALADGADHLLFCSRSHRRVQAWQMERRCGVRLCLQRCSRNQISIDDYYAAGSFPFAVPQRTTALIAQNDELAAELIDAGRRSGLEPGRDYKIIGFGDDPRFQEYELTTLRPDLPAIGSELAAAVVQSCTVPGCLPVVSKLIPSIPIRRRTL